MPQKSVHSDDRNNEGVSFLNICRMVTNIAHQESRCLLVLESLTGTKICGFQSRLYKWCMFSYSLYLSHCVFKLMSRLLTVPNAVNRFYA